MQKDSIHLTPSSSASTHVLIIDDQIESIEAYKILCEGLSNQASYPVEVHSATTAEAGLKILRETQVHVVLLDKDLVDAKTSQISNGITYIPEIKAARPYAEVIVLTASQDHHDVVEAMRLGAFSYAVKRIDNKILPEIVKKAASFSKASLKHSRLERQSTSGLDLLTDLPGDSFSIRRIKSVIDKISQTNVATLIEGETGTGKSCAARVIHNKRSKYFGLKDRPFQQLNLAVLSEDVAEVELFGAVKGAYTGAIAKPGHVELAHGGTLFIDEIGEATPSIQKKLLQILDHGTYSRVGEPGTLRKAEFHLITATNKDLEAMCEKGLFREDLYMRICGFKISMPPLRERKEDIKHIVKAVLPKVARTSNARIDESHIPASFLKYLAESGLKGNIRSIEHALSRLLTLAPRNKKGMPLLSRWENLDDFSEASRSLSLYTAKPITIKEIKHRSFDLNDKKFNGYKHFMKVISEELYKNAAQKYDSQKNIADLFRISESNVSRAFTIHNIKH